MPNTRQTKLEDVGDSSGRVTRSGVTSSKPLMPLEMLPDASTREKKSLKKGRKSSNCRVTKQIQNLEATTTNIVNNTCKFLKFILSKYYLSEVNKVSEVTKYPK